MPKVDDGVYVQNAAKRFLSALPALVEDRQEGAVERLLDIATGQSVSWSRETLLAVKNVTAELGLELSPTGRWWDQIHRAWYRHWCLWRAAERDKAGVQKKEHIRRAFPFRQYSCIRAIYEPAAHNKLDGLVFRVDDPFWEYHDPPWDDGCACTAIPRMASWAERESVDVRSLEYVRNVLGVGPGPDEYRPGHASGATATKRLETDLRDLLRDAPIAVVEDPLAQELEACGTREETLIASRLAVATWTRILESVTPDGVVDGEIGEQLRERVRAKLRHWHEQLAFIERRIAQDGRDD
ncbi:MAG TPA: hypothetical protein VM243_09195 [Phycisphaerae bacterium]|nr:hypothetical protein [Phycisphaerae bacterium]